MHCHYPLSKIQITGHKHDKRVLSNALCMLSLSVQWLVREPKVIASKHATKSDASRQFGGLCSQPMHAHEQVTCTTMATRKFAPFWCEKQGSHNVNKTTMSHMRSGKANNEWRYVLHSKVLFQGPFLLEQCIARIRIQNVCQTCDVTRAWR